MTPSKLQVGIKVVAEWPTEFRKEADARGFVLDMPTTKRKVTKDVASKMSDEWLYEHQVYGPWGTGTTLHHVGQTRVHEAVDYCAKMNAAKMHGGQSTGGETILP